MGAGRRARTKRITYPRSTDGIAIDRFPRLTVVAVILVADGRGLVGECHISGVRLDERAMGAFVPHRTLPLGPAGFLSRTSEDLAVPAAAEASLCRENGYDDELHRLRDQVLDGA